MTGNLRGRGAGCAGSLLRGLDEAGHGEGDGGVGEAGADAGAQLALDAPLLTRGRLDRDPSLVAVAVDVQDAGERGGGEHGLAPLRVLGEVAGDLLDDLGDQLVVRIRVDVE